MAILPFKSSETVSIGTELEFQIIDLKSSSLAPRAKELLRNTKNSKYKTRIKPEITQSMIEVNSSIHHSPNELANELLSLQKYLLKLAKDWRITFCGGGTHPFQKWAMQKIFPAARYKRLSKMYRYLSKQSTVFGQHIHIGCGSAEDALYLTHALARYVPQFIALSASSPFCQGVDTGFASSRSTIFNAFPSSGVIPYLINWQEFSDYFYKMRSLGIVHSMKDVYWDIRPKPEFGTVEIRTLDCPLTIKKTVQIVAYIQALSLYLLNDRPIKITPDLYHLYNYNRFQASRYSFDGQFIDPTSLQPKSIGEDIIDTLKKIERSANELHTMGYLSQIMSDVLKKHNDALWLRQMLKQHNSFPKVIAEQCKLWKPKHETKKRQ